MICEIVYSSLYPTHQGSQMCVEQTVHGLPVHSMWSSHWAYSNYRLCLSADSKIFYLKN